MTSEEQKATRRGPAVLLALLLSVLLGAPAPASFIPDSLPSGLKSVHPGKSTPATRTARRAAEDQADLTDLPDLWLGTAPRIETQLLSVRPAAAPVAAPEKVGTRSIRLPFQARAPPAA